MKKLIKQSIKRIIRLWVYVYSPELSNRLRVLYNQLYTIWLSPEFKGVGENTSLTSPMYLKGGKYISIGNNVYFGQRTRLEAWDKYESKTFLPEIIIGNNVGFSHDCHIGAINKILIGNDVLIGSKVFISDHSHGTINIAERYIAPIRRDLYSKGPVIIEDNVWIGEGVVILPNVKIGKNSIIGAASVVSRDIPSDSVACGNPAQIIKTLY